MMTAPSQITASKLQDQSPNMKEILERLRQRDSDLFSRIISVIRYGDEKTSRVLAAEVAEIRKVIMTIEHAMIDTPVSSSKPDLVLCPSCCSPEISISNTRCICLECGKDWTVGIKQHQARETVQYWSMA